MIVPSIDNHDVPKSGSPKIVFIKNFLVFIPNFLFTQENCYI